LLKIINNNKKRSNKYIYIPLERIKGGKIKLMEKNIQIHLFFEFIKQINNPHINNIELE
jgi:hypothetical protein